MRNLTLAIPEETLQKARVRAVKEGTSVNEVIRKYLEEYGSQEDRIRDAMDRVLEAAAKYVASAGSGAAGKVGKRKWSREETHERDSSRGR